MSVFRDVLFWDEGVIGSIWQLVNSRVGDVLNDVFIYLRHLNSPVFVLVKFLHELCHLPFEGYIWCVLCEESTTRWIFFSIFAYWKSFIQFVLLRLGKSYQFISDVHCAVPCAIFIATCVADDSITNFMRPFVRLPPFYCWTYRDEYKISFPIFPVSHLPSHLGFLYIWFAHSSL